MATISAKRFYLRLMSTAVVGVFAFGHGAFAEGIDTGFSNMVGDRAYVAMSAAGNGATSGFQRAASTTNLTKAAVTAIKGGGTAQLKGAAGAMAKGAVMGAAAGTVNSALGTKVLTANGSISTGGVINAVTKSPAFTSATSSIASTLGLSSGASGTLGPMASQLATAAFTGNFSAAASRLASNAVARAQKSASVAITGYATEKATALKNEAVASGKAALKDAYASYMNGESLGTVASNTLSTGLDKLPSFGDSISLGGLTGNGALNPDLSNMTSSLTGGKGFGDVASINFSDSAGGAVGNAVPNIANTVSADSMASIGSALGNVTSGSIGGISIPSPSFLGGSSASAAKWKTS